jgi:hypothetical protein
MDEGQRTAGRFRRAGEDGFSMITTVLSLVGVALAVALLLGTTLHSGGSSSTGVANAPGVAQADRLQAQQSLSTGLTAARAAAAGAGGFAGVTPSELESSNPSIAFLSGPSSGPTTVSVAASAEGGTNDAGGSGAGGGASGIAGIAGAVGQSGDSGGNTGDSGSGGGTGSITLADRSADGVCWLVWTSGAGTWYGAQTDLPSCTAPSLSAAPTSGPVSAAAIGWQTAGFPSP